MNVTPFLKAATEHGAQIAAEEARHAATQLAAEQELKGIRDAIENGKDPSAAEERYAAAVARREAADRRLAITRDTIAAKKDANRSKFRRSRIDALRSVIRDEEVRLAAAEADAVKALAGLSSAFSARDKARESLVELAEVLKSLGDSYAPPTPRDIQGDVIDAFKSKHSRAIEMRQAWGDAPAYFVREASFPVLNPRHKAIKLSASVVEALEADAVAEAAAGELN